VIWKSNWARLNSQLSLIKNCLGFRCCKDPRWIRIHHLWLQLGSGSPPVFLMLKVFLPAACLLECTDSLLLLCRRWAGLTTFNLQTHWAHSLLHRGLAWALVAHGQKNLSKGCPKGWGKGESSSSKEQTDKPNRPVGEGRGASRRAGGGCAFRVSLRELAAAFTHLLQVYVRLCPREEHPSRRKSWKSVRREQKKRTNCQLLSLPRGT